jgi:hypothetical protein
MASAFSAGVKVTAKESGAAEGGDEEKGPGSADEPRPPRGLEALLLPPGMRFSCAAARRFWKQAGFGEICASFLLRLRNVIPHINHALVVLTLTAVTL